MPLLKGTNETAYLNYFCQRKYYFVVIPELHFRFTPMKSSLSAVSEK
jgi:hypothetical protein